MEQTNIAKQKKRAVLVGAGELDTNCIEALRWEKENGSSIVALDGGLAFLEEHGISPDWIVGDFDSLPREKQSILFQYPQDILYRLPCEKDDTDTLAAIKWMQKKGMQEFLIYGGLGGRLSHTLANIQCLLYLKERGCSGELRGADSRIFLLKEESILLPEDSTPAKKGYISLFSYSEKAEGVTLKNLKYELEDAVLYQAFPLGVSNEMIGKTAEISVRKGILLVVIEEDHHQ